MLQEENDNILDKVSVTSLSISNIVHLFVFAAFLYMICIFLELHTQLQRAEERREAAEARAKELEKQVFMISSIVYFVYMYVYIQC